VYGDLDRVAPPPADWMWETLESQIQRLDLLLQKQGNLLDPAWPAASIKSARIRAGERNAGRRQGGLLE
jgi:hypothetical protein